MAGHLPPFLAFQWAESLGGLEQRQKPGQSLAGALLWLKLGAVRQGRKGQWSRALSCRVSFRSQRPPLVFYRNGTLQTQSFLKPWCLICPVSPHCTHSDLTADAWNRLRRPSWGCFSSTCPQPGSRDRVGGCWEPKGPPGNLVLLQTRSRSGRP